MVGTKLGSRFFLILNLNKYIKYLLYVSILLNNLFRSYKIILVGPFAGYAAIRSEEENLCIA